MDGLPEEWCPSHVVGTDGDAILSYAGIVRREIEHAGEVELERAGRECPG